MKEKKIILSKTNRILFKISRLVNILSTAFLAVMLIPFTQNDGQLCLPNYKYALIILLVLSFLAALLAGIALERIDKETRNSVS